MGRIHRRLEKAVSWANRTFVTGGDNLLLVISISKLNLRSETVACTLWNEIVQEARAGPDAPT